MSERQKTIRIEGATYRNFVYRTNFSGDPALSYDGKSTDKFFNIELVDGATNMTYGRNPLSIDELIDDGWNVRETKPNKDGETRFFIKVLVRFEKYPPMVLMTTSRNQIELDDSSIGTLDKVDIEKFDLVISPYTYDRENNRKSAYLKAMYVLVEEDDFEAKWRNRTFEEAPIDEDIPF